MRAVNRTSAIIRNIGDLIARPVAGGAETHICGLAAVRDVLHRMPSSPVRLINWMLEQFFQRMIACRDLD